MSSNENSGIQANRVHADVMAVGDHAKATKHDSRTSGLELSWTEAVEELKRTTEALRLSAQERTELEEHLAALHGTLPAAASGSEARGSLQRLNAKLVQVGAFTQNAKAVLEPLLKLAALVGLPSHLFSGG